MTPLLLYIAAVLAVGIGLAHSVLGERYILTRLFRRDNLPRLFGSDEFTARTLRFAWHLTTVAWWGFAVLMVQLASDTLNAGSVARVIAVTFLVTSAVTLVASRGKHFAWPVFLVIGGACLYAAMLAST